jgi:signal transduction histidine kinase/anti-sigma regulatory factor (Ser/Thr protein kinase)
MPQHSKQKKPALHFEPTAYIQRLLGRELISSEPIAIAELVKNAYDAGAKEIVITLHANEPQKLIIRDDGKGLSLPEFKRLWMRPGYSEKTIYDPKIRRTLLGEKGVGRFAADKLAGRLTVITKRSGESDALRVPFDWDDFEDRNKDIRKVNIYYERVRDVELVAGVSGTRLELEELRTKPWMPRTWKKLRDELKRLVVPKGQIRGFKTITRVEGAEAPDKWETGEVRPSFSADDVYKLVFSLSKSGNLVWSLSRPKVIARELDTKPVRSDTDTRTNIFGSVSGTFYYLDSSRVITNQGYKPGVGIYRDGFVVEPYGNEDNDWLEIKRHKASRQGHAPISPSRLFGFVEISRANNPKLKDVTNREGIQESKEFDAFRDFIKEQFDFFAKQIEEDKDRLDTKSESYKAQKTKQEREVRQTTFAEITAQLAHQLRQPLEAIGLDAGNLSAWVKKRGLKDESVEAATQNIKDNVKDINDHITLMRDRAKCYRASPTRFDLCAWMKEKVRAHRRSAGSSETTITLEGCNQEYTVSYSKEALGFVVNNLLQNALAAVSDVDRQKQITVSIETSKDGVHGISIVDNGKGLPKNYEEKLLKTNVKSTSGGTGFGLVFCQDVMSDNRGLVSFEKLETGTRFRIEFQDQEVNDE